MTRDDMLRRLQERTEPWDLVIIGGGATGVGIAVDAASRGYEVLLLEQSDFGKGTSSRSTKLVHGGVRYLQQGNIPLVMEALKERGILRENAPHLVHDLPFVVPNYQWWEAPFYGIGMRVYDALAGRYGFGASRNLSREETIERLPTIETDGLRGGVVYHDGQFDDARLLIHLVMTAAEQGAVVLNQARVTGLHAGDDGYLDAVELIDEETGRTHTAPARLVLNATGAFTDGVRHLDDPSAPPIVRPSQGVHVVLPRRFLPGESAIMVPHTDDGRVLFAIPWLDRVLIGTTDTPLESVALEPEPLAEEVDFILAHAARYLDEDPTRADVLSIFAGIRPLVGNVAEGGDTAKISREHSIQVSRSGLMTIAGGKWTTYRRMAEDAVDYAIPLAGLDARPCVTRELRLHGYHARAERFGRLAPYGSDAPSVEAVMEEQDGWDVPLHPRLDVTPGEVVWSVREEMARTVDDVLARRCRALVLDARAAIEAAPAVADLLARELGRDAAWRDRQVDDFQEMARIYVPE
ncbi:MAG: glycerol-3-phosphate dehydrogenase/oxidase [Gemmatimonadetes bacterium]|nr:glycerol-3-phosphate dehydrogenase/oxidase [Gemmatimonadota bacterium]